MNKIYLLPYASSNIKDYYSRVALESGKTYTTVWYDNGVWHASHKPNYYYSLEEAKLALDEFLINYGQFYLIKDEEVEKFQKKLKILL